MRHRPGSLSGRQHHPCLWTRRLSALRQGDFPHLGPLHTVLTNLQAIVRTIRQQQAGELVGFGLTARCGAVLASMAAA